MATLNDLYKHYTRNMEVVKYNQPSYFDCLRAFDLVERKILTADDYDIDAGRVLSTLVDLIALYADPKVGPKWDVLSVRAAHASANHAQWHHDLRSDREMDDD
jgi:hypothetical protein